MINDISIPNLSIESKDKSSHYYGRLNLITLALDNKGLKDLTDDEINQLIIEVYVHEYMHHLLGELYNQVVCTLYDIVESNFRSNLLEKYINEKHKNNLLDDSTTHKQIIKKYGLKNWLNRYLLSDIDIRRANQITNNKAYLYFKDMVNTVKPTINNIPVKKDLTKLVRNKTIIGWF